MMPVVKRFTPPLLTSPSRTGTAAAEAPLERDPFPRRETLAGAGASAKVFQASHAGQRPSHRDDSWPQAEQKKTERAFAIPRSLLPG
jgi:hypothetical protein